MELKGNLFTVNIQENNLHQVSHISILVTFPNIIKRMSRLRYWSCLIT